MATAARVQVKILKQLQENGEKLDAIMEHLGVEVATKSKPNVATKSKPKAKEASK